MARRHGFQLPLDIHQVGALLLVSGLVAGCYAFQLMMVPSYTAFVVLAVIYTCLAVTVLALDISCSLTDPSDPGICGGEGGEFYCTLCAASVGRNSKHCRACDRCVDGFDHHCKWLNNCVGQKNYGQFFALVTITTCMLALQLAWALWLFVVSFTDSDRMRLQVLDSYGARVNYDGWRVMLALYMLLLAAAVYMLGELFLFHLVLMSRGMSTYDFIIAEREDMRASMAAMGQEPQHAVVSVALLFWRLLKCQGCGPGTDNRVHAEMAANVSVPTRSKSMRVALNPCAACTAHKLEKGAAEYLRQAENRVTTSPAPAGEELEHLALKAKAAELDTPLSTANDLIQAACDGSNSSIGAGPVPENWVRNSPGGYPAALPWSAQQIARAYGSPRTPHTTTSFPYQHAQAGMASAVPMQASPSQAPTQLQSAFQAQAVAGSMAGPSGVQQAQQSAPYAAPARHLHSSPSGRQLVEARLSLGQSPSGAQLPPLSPQLPSSPSLGAGAGTSSTQPYHLQPSPAQHAVHLVGGSHTLMYAVGHPHWSHHRLSGEGGGSGGDRHSPPLGLHRPGSHGSMQQ